MLKNNDEYICLINSEEQYSLWESWQKIPLGWKKVGPTSTKQECLDFIKGAWKDMRPKSLRDKMDKINLKNQ